MEHTIAFYEGSYQFKVLVVEDTTRNNLYAGTLNELKDQYDYRPTDEDLWAEIRNESGKYLGRVSLVEKGIIGLVGLMEEKGLVWYPLTLLNPDYRLQRVRVY